MIRDYDLLASVLDMKYQMFYNGFMSNLRCLSIDDNLSINNNDIKHYYNMVEDSDDWYETGKAYGLLFCQEKGLKPNNGVDLKGLEIPHINFNLLQEYEQGTI